MLRNLLILLLTLFQDKYVRTGTLVGILIGIWNPEILQGEQGKSVIILGFVGWGIGAFLGYYFSLFFISISLRLRIFASKIIFERKI